MYSYLYKHDISGVSDFNDVYLLFFDFAYQMLTYDLCLLSWLCVDVSMCVVVIDDIDQFIHACDLIELHDSSGLHVLKISLHL